jgi:cytochrome c biogenesis protein CcmG, thiol:disulfide interchange protein DsbE
MAHHPTHGWIFRALAGCVLLSGLNTPVASPEEGIGPNHPAPQFTREALDGSQFTLASSRGKVVLLTFWASWCGPCLLEMPTFAHWQTMYAAQGLQIVGVSMDDERQDAVKAYHHHNLNYPVVMGDAALGDLYGGVLGLPLTYLIDRKGIIRYRHDGVADLNAMEGQIRTLLTKHSTADNREQSQ